MNAIAAGSHGSSVLIAATASSVAGAITMPSGFNGLHIANFSATLGVSVRYGVGAQTAVLGDSISIPPMRQVVVEATDKITDLAAIGSGAGPTSVVFTPVRLP